MSFTSMFIQKFRALWIKSALLTIYNITKTCKISILKSYDILSFLTFILSYSTATIGIEFVFFRR